MGAIVAGLQYLLNKVVAFATWIGKLFQAVFVAIWDLFRDGVVWVFDSFLALAVSILNAFDFSGLTQAVGAWASLPAGVIEVLNGIGLGGALAVVVSAIGIRLLLQLVPLTRLGS